jgi:hypothetical protein
MSKVQFVIQTLIILSKIFLFIVDIFADAMVFSTFKSIVTNFKKRFL